jgi:pyrimidine-nucleoside phosphorylase
MISNSSTDAELISAARAVADIGKVEDICALTRDLAESGATVESASLGSTADVASTGSPFSLTTLICPLLLVASGHIVPKLGVPGRPAGGIDCLLQIPGYRADFGTEEVIRILKQCGYAHFLAAGRIAPLDARLFVLRQANGLQAVPKLAIASILSKKLAAQVVNVGLDVRVAPWGNFGADFAAAEVTARTFAECASALGLLPYVFLSDATTPYQPYLGRAESLVAMVKILDCWGSPKIDPGFSSKIDPRFSCAV